MLRYKLPLGEIASDFAGELKSRTSGYATFDYELAGWQFADIAASTSSLTVKSSMPWQRSVTAQKASTSRKKSSKKSKMPYPDRCLKSPSRRRYRVKSSLGKPFLRCGKTSSLNATAVTFPGRKSCCRSKGRQEENAQNGERGYSRRRFCRVVEREVN